MTNWEKFREELLKIAATGYGFGVIDGKPIHCIGASCNDCLFVSYNLGNPCYKRRLKWLDEEYEEPKAGNSCKACKYFHLGEGLINTGICSISLGATTVFDMCESYHEKGEADE